MSDAGELRRILQHGIEEWLRLYRNQNDPKPWDVSSLVSLYEAVLPSKLSPFELRAGMNEAMKMTRFMPTPKEVLDGISMGYGDRPSDGTLEEMKTWRPSDPSWAEVKEFFAKMREVSRIAEPTPHRSGGHSAILNSRSRQARATG